MPDTIVVDPYVTKSGKLAIFYVADASVIQNGNYRPLVVTGVSGTPTIQNNEQTIQIGPPTTTTTSFKLPLVSYLLQCGSVQSLCATNAGILSYTSPAVNWNGDGGGTGLQLDTPSLASGIIKYNITNSGTGYTTSFPTPVTGGNYQQQAYAWVNVSGNKVISVVPMTGSVMSYGSGYIANFSTTLPGSAAMGYDGTFSTWTNQGQPGAGLAVNCIVGNYIVNVPVINGGHGFLSCPTFSVTDSTGSGAVFVPIMSGPLSSDVLTYSAPSGWLITATGVAPAAVNVAVSNYVGQLEQSPHSIGFNQTPTMGIGGNLGITPTYYGTNTFFTGKNKLKAANPWQPNPDYLCGPSTFAVDSSYFPLYWTPNTYVTSQFYSSSTIDQTVTSVVSPQGNWALQYNDDYYTGGSTYPAYINISAVNSYVTSTIVPGKYTRLPVAGTVHLDGNSAVSSIDLVDGGAGLTGAIVVVSNNTGSLAAYVPIITNGSITSLVKICGGVSYSPGATAQIIPIDVVGSQVTIIFNLTFPKTNAGQGLFLTLNMVSGPDGFNHVRNAWVFAPNNTIDRSDPFATDDNVIRTFQKNNRSISILRFMEAVGGAINPNIIDPSDGMDPNAYSWDQYFNFNSNVPQNNPNGPTFYGNLNANSAVITNLSSTANIAVGQQIVGSGIPGINFPNSLTTILSISGSTLTMSASGVLTGYFPLSTNPTTGGRVTFSSMRAYNTNPSNSGYAWSSPKIYSNESWAINSDSFGRYLDLTIGPFGANDSGRFVVNSVNSSLASANFGIIELISTLPHGLKTGTSLGGFGFDSQSFNGTTVSGSPVISTITGNALLYQYQNITGNGIPSDTHIISTSGSTVTLSRNSTITNSGSTPFASYTAVPYTGGLGNQNLNNGTAIIPNLYVTGPSSVLVVSYFQSAGLVGTVPQTAATNSPIQINFKMIYEGNQMWEPVEYTASMTRQLPGCILHLNVPFICSDAVITDWANRTADNIGPNNTVLLEMGNEHWGAFSSSTELPWEVQMAYLLQYLPSGTQTYPHYDKNRNLNYFTTSGPTTNLGDRNDAYCLRAANRHYVFCQQWIARGLDPMRVKLAYGGQWTGQSSQYMAQSTIRLNLPQDYIMVAPYYGSTTDNAVVTANCPAGYGGNTNAGNWPADAMNDFFRHFIFYDQELWNYWAALNTYIQGTDLQLICYEGATQSLAVNIPFSDQVQQDMFYHPSFYDAVWAYWLSLQIGSPLIKNSGFAFMDYFSIFNNNLKQQLWKLGDGVSQPIGYGNNNKFVTPQGGSPGGGNPFGYYQTNEAVGLKALNDWLGISGPLFIPDNGGGGGGGHIYQPNGNIISNQFTILGVGNFAYPYLGIHNKYNDNKPTLGVNTIKPNVSGSFASMFADKYILLNNPGSNYFVRGQNLNNPYINTWLKNITGGWYYQNGQPVNPQYSRDRIGTDKQNTQISPGKMTFQYGSNTAIIKNL